MDNIIRKVTIPNSEETIEYVNFDVWIKNNIKTTP